MGKTSIVGIVPSLNYDCHVLHFNDAKNEELEKCNTDECRKEWLHDQAEEYVTDAQYGVEHCLPPYTEQ